MFSTCRNQERLHGGGENDNYYSKLWSVTWRSGQVKGERREETGAQLTEVTPCVLSCWPFCFRGFLFYTLLNRERLIISLAGELDFDCSQHMEEQDLLFSGRLDTCSSL